MPNVLIRDLDPTVHAKLAARAEQQGRSLQQYLTAELTKLAARSTLEDLFAEIHAREDRPNVGPEVILDALHRGRTRAR